MANIKLKDLMKEVIQDRFPDKNFEYAIQEKPKGISHALLQGREYLENIDTTVFVLGDNFFENRNELSVKEFYKSWIQFFIYIIAILISLIYVKFYNKVEIEKDSQYLSNFSAYIIRSCFWGVLIIGIVDMILSFLRVEDFLIPLFGENLGMDLGDICRKEN